MSVSLFLLSNNQLISKIQEQEKTDAQYRVAAYIVPALQETKINLCYMFLYF